MQRLLFIYLIVKTIFLLQALRDKMRQMQPGLQQQRPGDEGARERLPHRVLPLLGVQQATAAGGRVLPAGGRAALPGRPQPAAGEELRRKPHQPRTHALQQTAAPLRYRRCFSSGFY